MEKYSKQPDRVRLKQTRSINNRTPRKIKKRFKLKYRGGRRTKDIRLLCQNWFGEWVFCIDERTVTL